MKFTYRSKGSVDDWTDDVIEAKDKQEAQNKLDEIYGIQRDDSGVQTNSDMINVEILGETN